MTAATTTTPTAPAKDRTLHCHCRLHTITLDSVPLDSSPKISCNRSICSDRGAVLSYVPISSVSFLADGVEKYGDEGLALVKDTLTTYEFGQRRVKWRFCSRCGSNLLGREGGRRGV